MRPVRLALALSAFVLSGCSIAVGGAAGAVLIGAGVFASGCYDHLDVTVRTPSGLRICDARVTAVRDGSTVDLVPCFSAALSAGTWQIRAEHGGHVAQSALTIPEDRECGRTVHRIDLTLGPQRPTSSETTAAMRSSGTTSSTTPSSTAARGMP